MMRTEMSEEPGTLLSRPFLEHRELLRREVLPELRRGADHNGIEDRFDEVLLLAERLLLSSVATADHGDLLRRLEKIFAEPMVDRFSGTDLVVECLEAWLKLVLARIDPAHYKANLGNKKFTLYPVVEKLRLLTQAELGDSSEKIADHVRRFIRMAQAERNPSSHGAPERSAYHADVMLCAVRVTMVAAVDRHRDTLKKSLLGLITSPLDPRIEAGLVRMIRSERERHIHRFSGREAVCKDILDNLTGLLRETGGYLLVRAPEGYGKSAIAAQITRILGDGVPHLGADAAEVSRACPWLVGALYHAGKQSMDPQEFVPSLLAQANALLVRPVAIQQTEFDEDKIKALGHSSQGGFLFAKQAHVEELRSARSGGARGDVTTPRFDAPADKSHRVLLRSALYTALERLVEERGHAVLVVDSLDEISRSGSELLFLPPILPKGASVLLTSRPEQGLLDFLHREMHVREIALDGLLLEEVKQITGVEDDDWIRRLYQATRGIPLYVQHKAEQIREQGGSHLAIDPAEGNQAVFRGQLNRWKQAGAPQEMDPLYQTLLLLAIFEPLSPLDLYLIQGYLAYRGISIAHGQLRGLLEAVSSQVEGLAENRVKLGVKAFAAFVLHSEVNKRDLRELLRTVSSWLAQESDAPVEIRASFILYWSDKSQVQDAKLRDAGMCLVKSLAEMKLASDLFKIYDHWSRKGRSALPEAIRGCLVEAARLGDLDAAAVLGSRLLDGRGVPRDIREGEYHLRQAAQAEHPGAMVELGGRLIDGKSMTRNPAEGKEWLERAAALGSSTAMCNLGVRLLDGDGLLMDADEGASWLRRAVDEGSEFANFEFTVRQIQGLGINKSASEGIERLREAALAGSVKDAAMLGIILSTNEGPEYSREESERWLRHAAERNDGAMGMLGSIAIDDDKFPISAEEGARWLQRSAERGNLRSMRELARRLLDGDRIDRSPGDGERWLRKAVEGGSVKAVIDLAVRLLDGIGLSRNPDEGSRLLRKAADDGEPAAMTLLGSWLLGGSIVTPKNAREGEMWFRKAADAGHAAGAYLLGYALYERSLRWKKQLAADLRKEAGEWLMSSFERGIWEAGTNIAYMVRRGEYIIPMRIGGFDDLLRRGLEEHNVFAIINEALRRAVGFQCDENWEIADGMIGRLDADKQKEDLNAALEWWTKRALDQDPEGHLVLGWLVRHGLITDRQGIDVAQRMTHARKGWPKIPSWMDEVANSTPNVT